MKKLKCLAMLIIIIICLSSVSFAHGGNITGWKDINSKSIIESNGSNYGYHKENGEKHYHKVKWDEENAKWVIVLPAVYYDKNLNKIERNYDNTEKTEVELISVVDGDTAKFRMKEKETTVRFLGINTKETVDPEIGEEKYGKEGSNFTKDKLENATKIELEYDSAAGEKDKYNRHLCWVWVNGELLQDLLVKEGLAETYMLQNNYKYAGTLQESEEIAKSSKLGIWSEETDTISNTEKQVVENESGSQSKEEEHTLPIIICLIIILITTIIKISYSKGKRK